MVYRRCTLSHKIKSAKGVFMKIIADTHTHTIMSGHAHSTVMENIKVAKEKGLKFIAITDHTKLMPDCPGDVYFSCMRSALPDEYDGVYILRGCEANIIDANGTVDISDKALDLLEWRIASIHSLLTKPMGFENHTKLWTNIAKNPRIDVIGQNCTNQNVNYTERKCLLPITLYRIPEIRPNENGFTGNYITQNVCRTHVYKTEGKEQKRAYTVKYVCKHSRSI